ncbi:MAG: TonB-dependent receptor [candidate division KSB1 bacterium]|nr:TonB-dependent receptor [candidate division KSB1 bacterium]MDZ7368129.1 TonB-dependent receptor [candidate division KSB1 bacterium]MDZ7405807.1 TonB-dependent receptor [candidate division KSB1 bacterium]
MKNKLKTAILIVALLMAPMVSAQNTGQLSGKVTDVASGEALIGANVIIEGTQLGATVDLDGNYWVRGIPAGTYNVRFSLIGYAVKIVNNIVIEAGKTARLDVILREEIIQGEEIVVEATAIMSSEKALLQQQRKAATIGDAVAAEQIKRAPDATTGDALRRVTGVSIVDNKFVYVRGTSERYSNTLLNGAQLSSTEPDKKAYAFDTLPSNLVENTIISKSFTPDLPGNFSGGLVQINTIEFPEKLTIRLSAAGSYNTASTGGNFRTYEGSKWDFLGIDDGTRKLPSAVNGSKIISSNYSPSELQAIGRSFPNIWRVANQTAAPNSSYMLSLGSNTSLFGRRLGYIGALSYRNSFDRIEIVRNDYNFDGTPQFEYEGDEYRFSVLWGGLLNLSYKLGDFHKISFKNLYNRAAEDEVIELRGNYYDAGNEQKNTGLRFVSRSSYSGQLMSEHAFPKLAGLQWNWRAAYSAAERDEPDYRRVIYSRGIDSPDPFRASLSFVPNPASGGRFFATMNDHNWDFASDFTLQLSRAKLKFGGLFNTGMRDFSARIFAYKTTSQTDYRLLYSDLDMLFAPQHIGARGFEIDEITNGADKYDASQQLAAGYFMIDLPFQVWNKNLRLIAGTRVENNAQKLSSFDQQDRPVNVNLKKTDLLPSFNLTYSLTATTNIRAAFSRTVSRPEFRELAPFAFFDFSTVSVIYGNPSLRRALIRNYDVRFEMFPDIGEILSASIFYKDFTDAIEEVIVPTTELTRSYGNADKARNYGFELEMRKSLRFLGNTFSNFSLTANYALIQSKVDLQGSSQAIAKEGRRLQGQSPYMINLGLLYTSLQSRTSVSLLYNRFGKRIAQVGSLYDDDIIEMPRDLLDFTLLQNLGDHYELKISARDILRQEQEFIQAQRKVKGNQRGSTYSLGFSVKY